MTVRRIDCITGILSPASLARKFQGLDEEPETRKLVAAEQVAARWRAVVRQGLPSRAFFSIGGGCCNFRQQTVALSGQPPKNQLPQKQRIWIRRGRTDVLIFRNKPEQ